MLALGACSAVVNPDPGRLGGAVDAGRADEGADGADSAPDVGCATDCDDGVACTEDRCEGSVCVSDPQDSRCGEDERCTLDGCVDASCERAEDCDDGLLCNGEERCQGGTCVRGEAVVCDDGVECTVDRCDEGLGRCAAAPDDAACDDGVECTVDRCGETGCERTRNDALCDDGFCFVGAVCTAEGCAGGEARDCSDGRSCTSDSCDGEARECVNDPIDMDGDGSTLCDDVPDCNDDDRDIFPGAEEECDREDNDCDEEFDEGVCEAVLPDRCETAQRIELSDAGETRINGFLEDFANDYDSACGGERGPDAVFVLDVDPSLDYVISTAGSEADTILAVSPDCGSFSFAGLGCNDDFDTDISFASALYLRRLGSSARTREVFILLDSFSRDGGQYTLSITALESAELSCEEAPFYPPVGTAVGFIERAAPSGGFGRCGGVSEAVMQREAVFRARVSDGDQFTLHSDDFTPLLYAWGRCSIPNDLECDRGDPADIEVEVEGDERNIVLFADGAGGGGGFYTLERRN
ncbi:MAG: hypothetical protein AAF645_04060 [Myxococcota bacterium]